MLRYLVFGIVSSLLLSSCTSLDSSCLQINWYELGRQDSTRGIKEEKTFSERQKICPIREDSIYAKAYKNGFAMGLKSYCNFKTGYIYSMSERKEELSACPEDLKVKFQKGYEAGTRMKEIESMQNGIQQKIQELTRKLQDYESNISMNSKSNFYN